MRHMNAGRRWLSLFLLTAVVIEIASHTYWFGYGDKRAASIVYLSAGLLAGLFPLLKTKAPGIPPIKAVLALKWAFFGICTLFIFWRMSEIISIWPLDYRNADMLPIIRIMGERLLGGEEVYAVIPEIWGGMQPIYLPAMWLPYVPPIAFGIDLRWTNALFLIAALFFSLNLSSGKKGGYGSLLVFLPLGLLLWYIFRINSTLPAITEEPVVICFYLFLGFALLKNNPFILGTALAFCLMSRYAMAPWGLVLLVYVFLFVSKKSAVITALTTAAASLILLALGQAFSKFGFFLGLQSNYLADIVDPEKKWGVVHIIEQSPGLARFVPYEHLPLLHKSLFGGSFILPVLLFGIFHFHKEKINRPLFFLCSLKIYLVFFFNMLPQPFSYLFYTSSFLSLAILSVFLNQAAD